jgi:ABC-2 type transport system permease protein
VRKEFHELRRDRYARIRLIVPPILQMLIFGYAATFDVSHVSTALLDRDHSQESRALVARFVDSGRFRIDETARDDGDITDTLENDKAVVGLVIHAGFAQGLHDAQGASMQVVVDGTNSNTALIASGYVGQIASGYAAELAAAQAERRQPLLYDRLPQVTLQTRTFYNPNLDGKWFFVPGVIGTLLLMMIVNLTAFAIVREREMGTLEQIMVTPIRPWEFILGKTIPAFLIGLAEAVLIGAVGVLWFRVPFSGSVAILLLGTVLFLLSAVALGLLLSTLSRTQQQAFAANFFVLNPLFILSGFAFPIASMPEALRWVAAVNPVRWYLVVIRATFLKDVGLAVLWPDLAAMGTIGGVLLLASILRFRKSLE